MNESEMKESNTNESNMGGGLKPVIVQDATTKEVLMLAYANEEAVEKTKETGYAWYWSRSRNKLWWNSCPNTTGVAR